MPARWPSLGGFESRIHEKGACNHPLSDAAKERNRIKSAIRACVDHVFGVRQGYLRGISSFDGAGLRGDAPAGAWPCGAGGAGAAAARTGCHQPGWGDLKRRFASLPSSGFLLLFPRRMGRGGIWAVMAASQPPARSVRPATRNPCLVLPARSFLRRTQFQGEPNSSASMSRAPCRTWMTSICSGCRR